MTTEKHSSFLSFYLGTGRAERSACSHDMTGCSEDVQAYLTHGIEKIVAASLKATLRDPKESTFMAKFAVASRKASKAGPKRKR